MTCVRETTYCNCDTCAELRLTPADLFQLVEDERAEFEATFKAMDYVMTRSTRLVTDCCAVCDYHNTNTAHAWMGWLCAADVQWCVE